MQQQQKEQQQSGKDACSSGGSSGSGEVRSGGGGGSKVSTAAVAAGHGFAVGVKVEVLLDSGEWSEAVVSAGPSNRLVTFYPHMKLDCHQPVGLQTLHAVLHLSVPGPLFDPHQAIRQSAGDEALHHRSYNPNTLGKRPLMLLCFESRHVRDP